MTAGKGELVVSERFLNEAARNANEHHQQAVDAATRVWFEHAVMVGEILLNVQRQVSRGEWGQFVKERLTFQQRAANMYMRIATYKEYLAVNHPPTFTEAVHRLQHLPSRQRPSPVNAETVESMRQMLGTGMSGRAVARELGVDNSTVRYWTDREGFLKKRNQVRKAHSRAYQKVAEKTRADEMRDMTAHGGALRDAYRLVRRALTAVENIDEGESPSNELLTAAKHLHLAERQLVSRLRREQKGGG